MSESPPILDEVPAPNRFASFAVGFSLLTPLIAIIGCVCLFEYLRTHGHTNLTTISVMAFAGVVVVIAGLGLGLVALAITRQHQRQRLLGKALAGICLNGLLLVLLVVVPLLLPLLMGTGFPTTPQGRLEVALKKLAEASNAEHRFYALNDAAKESFNVGKIDYADKFAKELLKLAPDFQSNWNYGNAIQDGNLVLGRIAVRDGRMEDANKYLLAAGNSPGSPQMDSFGPNMSLAKDLLQKGERDTVLQYFQLCRKFWRMDYGKLNQWSSEVKAGKIPDFGANLVY
jgi:tetratricopeptide (TPR) repeat protein